MSPNRLGLEGFRGIEQVARNSTIKVSIFSKDPNYESFFLGKMDYQIVNLTGFGALAISLLFPRPRIVCF